MNENTLKVQVLEVLKHDPEIIELLTERLEKSVLFRELHEFRQEVNKRFEAMQEQMDRRFEAVQEQMDRRFEAMQEQMDRRFEAMLEQLKGTQDWVGIVVGGFQVRAGRSLEDAIAGTLSVALRMKNIKPENIRMRQKLVDRDGLIGPAGRQYEYDILVSDHETLVFEIKSSLDIEGVERFSDKVDLVARVLGLAQVRKVIVSLEKRPEVVARCRELNIELA